MKNMKEVAYQAVRRHWLGIENSTRFTVSLKDSRELVRYLEEAVLSLRK